MWHRWQGIFCWLIMSPRQIEAGEDACAQAPVGTGQYKFVEWVAGDDMKVELNKDWLGYDADVCSGTALADADAGFKSITFKPVAESATRVSAIQAGDPNFSISHTSTGNSLYIHLNGKVMSECMLNSYAAASHHVPVLFLSGDEEICRQAKELIPGITTVETKHGVGAATWCKAKGKAISEIRKGVKKAVAGQKKECQVALPERFTYEVTYKDWKKAYTMSFYPGMQKVDTFTNKLETDCWMDIITAHCFVVY